MGSFRNLARYLGSHKAVEEQIYGRQCTGSEAGDTTRKMPWRQRDEKKTAMNVILLSATKDKRDRPR